MCKDSAINHNSPRHRLHTQLVGCSCLSLVDLVQVPLFGMFNSHDGSVCQFWAVLPPRVVCGPFMFVRFLHAGACLSSLVGCIRYCILSLLVNRDLVKHVLIFHPDVRTMFDVWIDGHYFRIDKHPPRVLYTLRQGQSHPVTDLSPSPHSLLVPSVCGYRRPGETTQRRRRATTNDTNGCSSKSGRVAAPTEAFSHSRFGLHWQYLHQCQVLDILDIERWELETPWA